MHTDTRRIAQDRFKLTGADWIAMAGFAVLSAILFFLSVPSYVYPGESASLAALWKGLDVAPFVKFPVFKSVAGLFGYSNLVSPICGMAATIGIYCLTVLFIRSRFPKNIAEDAPGRVLGISIAGGIAAAAVFMTSECVREAAMRFEPRLFAAALAIWTFVMVGKAFSVRAGFLRTATVLLTAALAGVGLADNAVFLMLMPFYLFSIHRICIESGKKPWGLFFAFAVVAFFTFLVFSLAAAGSFAQYLLWHKSVFRGFVDFRNKAWFAIFLSTVLPFLFFVFTSRRIFLSKGNILLVLFMSTMSVFSILAVFTPISPSALMKPAGYLPVCTTVMASFTVGGIVSFWFSRTGKEIPEAANGKFMPIVSSVMLGIYAVLFVFTTIFTIARFDKSAGAFADFAAERILEDLGDRSWLITDGTLDSHLRLMAERKGKKINLVCLQRDGDKSYIDFLCKKVKDSKIGGKRNSDLVYSLKLGILPFVQEWISCDDDIGGRLAVYGAPDLFRYNEKLEVVPETWFFGADKSVKVAPDAWTKLKAVFAAPEKWGSYRMWKENRSLERMRLNIRRHLGFVANNRGVYLEDKGDRDAAFAMYDRVLSEIDADNVCALFNEIEMMRSGYAKAVERKTALNRKFDELKADPDRRFRLMPLYHYYGYIRNPEIFIRAGISWARSGRPGEAISQIRRAIDFIPTENRNTLMNMLASLYASENDQAKSRSVYEQVLSKDATNHSALIGLMRLELLNGNREKALEFLERAIAGSGDDPRAKVEKAMKHMILNETGKAREILKAAAKSDGANMQIWSLLTAATIQELKSVKDPAKRGRLMDELEKQIIPAMEKKAKTPNDYFLQTSKAHVLLEKGAEFRREARDAFARAAAQRPDIAATADIILGLDISLDDVEDAERRAREVLRRNRRAPLANYVMGALALRRGAAGEAESFLRRSVESENPPVLALNDYAETLRRRKQFAEAEKYARLAVEKAPELYVAWETLASTLLDAGSSLDEAEKAMEKACKLSTDKTGKIIDVRMLITLARIQKAKGNIKHAVSTAQKVRMRYSELSEFEQGEFEEFLKGVR